MNERFYDEDSMAGNVDVDNDAVFSRVPYEYLTEEAKRARRTSLPYLNRKERDHHGKERYAPGTKLDEGKPRCTIVLGNFSKALLAVSEVGTIGAQEYADDGWKYVPNAVERYTDAAFRHLLKELMGENYDKDSKCLHAAHFAWNALARLEKILEEKQNVY